MLQRSLIVILIFFLNSGFLKAKSQIYLDYNQKNDLKLLSSLKKVGMATARRDLPESYITPEGNFKIHYTNSGVNAVDSVEYVYEVGKAAEHSYSLLMDTLGFDPPPVDNIDGEQIDIYIIEYSGRYYANTYLESKNKETSREYDYISYMEIDNNYNETSYSTQGLDGMRVTVAHEFFHMVQLGYNYFQSGNLPGMVSGDTFFLEWSSVWFEEVAYPEINDYWQYLAGFLNYPYDSMWDSYYWYSLGIFISYITKNYGESMIKLVWEKIKDGKHAVHALDHVLEERTGENLFWHWNRFFQVCYYTGNRYNANYSLWEDAQYFPELKIDSTGYPAFEDEQHYTSQVSAGATASFQLIFDKNLYLGIEKNPAFKDSLTNSFTIHNNRFSDISDKFNLNQNSFIGKVTPRDTLILFFTNTTLYDMIEFDFTISEQDKPFLATKILNIYPNPINSGNRNQISAEIVTDKRNESFTLTLYDILGRKINTQKFAVSRNLVKPRIYYFNLKSGLSSGLYILQCKTKDETVSKKITILQ